MKLLLLGSGHIQTYRNPRDSLERAAERRGRVNTPWHGRLLKVPKSRNSISLREMPAQVM